MEKAHLILQFHKRWDLCTEGLEFYNVLGKLEFENQRKD